MSIPKQRGRLAAESCINGEGWPECFPYGEGTAEHQAWMEGWRETMGSNAAALARLKDGLHEEIVRPEGD